MKITIIIIPKKNIEKNPASKGRADNNSNQKGEKQLTTPFWGGKMFLFHVKIWSSWWSAKRQLRLQPKKCIDLPTILNASKYII